MTLDDLLLREAEPWFDPAGFILVEQIGAPPPALAAFHWTKVHGHEGGVHPPVGEVYVVGVDPAYQGSRPGPGGDPRWGCTTCRTGAWPRRCSTSTATTRPPSRRTPGWASSGRPWT